MAAFQRLWAHDLHQLVYSRALVFTPKLVVQERITRIACLDEATGEAVWEARVQGRWGWLRASASHVLYLNQYDRLQCLTLRTGLPLWEVELGRAAYGNVVPLTDRVVVGGWRGYTRVQCLDIESGERLWWLPTRESVAEPIAGPWGLALPRIAPPPSDLVIVDPETGARLNRRPLPPGVMDSDAGSSVQRYQDGLLITTVLGEIWLLDPTLDQPPSLVGVHDSGIASIRPTVLGTFMLFQDADRALCVYDLSAGRLLWSVHLEPHLDWRIWRIPAALLASGEIVVGTSEGRLYLYDLGGREIAVKTVARRILTDIWTIGENRLVFGTKGEIVAYRIT